ncbi:hypothetical protein DTO271G3_1129 [Paecilomyces variotii]|nr:hypothetical protein DTO271G3_1129 [Paecilomyces variotii]
MSKATYKDEPPRSSAASAYSLQPYADHVEADISPVYAEPEAPGIDALSQQPVSHTALLPDMEAYCIPGGTTYAEDIDGSQESTTVSCHPDLSSDPKMLWELIKSRAELPPRQYILIRGTHSETVNDDKGQKKKGEVVDLKRKKEVVDFEFNLDVAAMILRGWKGDGMPPSSLQWHTVTVVSDHDMVDTYRGGRLMSQSPGEYPWVLPRRTSDTEVDVERGQGGYADDGDGNDQAASLLPEKRPETIHAPPQEVQHAADSGLGWCERFCADPAPVKSFKLTRTLGGFSSKSLRDSIVSHIRATSYRGHISVKTTLREESVTIYSPHWVNRFRNNPYIFWTCIIFQLWIVTWPAILLMERQYHVIFSNWYASLVSMEQDPSNPGVAERRKIYARNRDEVALMDYWAPAIKHAAWNRRRNGEIVTEQDARNYAGMSDDEIMGSRKLAVELELDIDCRERIIRGVGEVNREWTRATGWGDDC